jgi:hypothetical protein
MVLDLVDHVMKAVPPDRAARSDAA